MKTHHRVSIVSSFVLLAPALAHAHHAMDGKTPSSWYEGLLSGLAHPVIGLDHLAFVLALGAACWFFRRGAGTVAAFLVATLAGAGAHLYSVSVPYADAWVAVTLLVAGAMLLRVAPFLESAGATAFFALAGLAHGYAYGESIAGAEPTPLIAYLAGFVVVQIAIGTAGYLLARTLDRRHTPRVAARAFGGALSIAGSAFLLLAFAG